MKIPVFRTIGDAYGFVTGNLATIVGLIWLPLVVQSVAGYIVIVRYFGALSVVAVTGDFSALAGIVSELFGFAFLSVFLSAVIAAPVTCQALGLREGGAYIQFALGKPTFRLFGANLAFMLAMASIFVLAWIAVVVILVGTGLMAKTFPAEMVGSFTLIQIVSWCAIAVITAILGALLFIVVRFGFLIAPVTIAERRIDLVRAWTLTQGNFWRIFFVYFATVIPIAVIALAIPWALYGFHVSAPDFLAPPAQHPTVFTGAAVQFQRMRDNMLVPLCVALFIAPLRIGLELGAAAAAYRALVPPSEPTADAAVPPVHDSTSDLASAAAGS